MMYLLLFVVVLVMTFLLTRVRIRVELSPEKRILFVGLGRTGPELDFLHREIHLCLSGFPLKRLPMARTGEAAESASVTVKLTPKKMPDPEQRRRRSFGRVVDAIPQSVSALWKYVIGLLKAAIIERAEGEIEAGFEAPHITGQVYGCYQVALAAAPSLMGRFRYTPVWTGPTFSGALRISIAWPVYRLLWQTMLLVWRLPKRKLVRLAIGEKKGAKHVK